MNKLNFRNGIRLLLVVVLFLGTITEAAFNEASGAPARKSIPSWFIYGDRDLNIPAALHAFMADRANSKETVAVSGASHVVMISHADAVAEIIEHAATAL